MKQILIIIFFSLFALTGCLPSGQPVDRDAADGDSIALSDSTPEGEPADSIYGEWNSEFRKIAPTSIVDNVVKLIGKDWMLITAGTEESFNSMTASWGAIGEIWSVPAAFITVRNTRYTHEFLTANDHFTLCFFHDDHREALRLLGSKSGRDSDKIEESGLTPMDTPSGSVAYRESRMIIECRKMYAGPLRPENIVDKEIVNHHYKDTPREMHTLFIGEIENVWVKN